VHTLFAHPMSFLQDLLRHVSRWIGRTKRCGAFVFKYVKFARAYVCTYEYFYVDTYIDIWHICICMCVCVCVCVCMCLWVHAYMCIYTYVYIRIFNICVHWIIYVYICIRMKNRLDKSTRLFVRRVADEIFTRSCPLERSSQTAEVPVIHVYLYIYTNKYINIMCMRKYMYMYIYDMYTYIFRIYACI